MESFERTESRGRKALLWGIGTMLVFSFLAGLMGYLAHLGAEHYDTEQRVGEILAYGFGAIAIAGFLTMLFGYFELGTASRREHHPRP